jgi:DnaJ-class molecular chaperone
MEHDTDDEGPYTCDECDGSGMTPEGDICPECHGEGVVDY